MTMLPRGYLPRSMHIEDGTVYIRIASKAHGEQVIIFDESDLPLLQEHTWSIGKGKETYYARTHVRINGKQKFIAMHRLLMGFPNQPIDHKNRNGLDNRRSNLRPATNAQNQANSRLQRNNTSGHRGLYWNKTLKKWQVYMKKNGQRNYLGSFLSKEEAASVYAKAFIEFYGEYASSDCI